VGSFVWRVLQLKAATELWTLNCKIAFLEFPIIGE